MEHKLDLKRQANERSYAQKLAELDEEIAHERRLQKEQSDELDRERTLQQRLKDLIDTKAASAKREAARRSSQGKPASVENQETSNGPLTSGQPRSAAETPKKSGTESVQAETSEACAEWQYQKQFEMAENQFLDELMGMIGLESVKTQVLDIKKLVDTRIRQGVDLKNERFGVALLGNPGTGRI